MADIQAWDPTDASNVDLFPENMAFSAVNDGGRAVQGVIARWFADTNGALAAGGSANAFTLASSRTIAALFDGLRMSFRANHSITGAATLNLNGLGAKDIKRFNGSALAAGDIISGQPVDVIYSSALDDWIMVSALAALVGSMFADFGENASPGNPAADTGRLSAFDDSGTTMLRYGDSGGTFRELLGRATQAQMEAATDVRQGVSAGRQHFHPGHFKATGRGAAAGGVVGTAYNVTSVVKNATGHYTVTLSVTMSSTNYWVLVSAVGTGGSLAPVAQFNVTAATTFDVYVIRYGSGGGVLVDADFAFGVLGDI